MFFTNRGRVYSLKCYQIPEAGRTARGIAIVNLLALTGDEKVTAMDRAVRNAVTLGGLSAAQALTAATASAAACIGETERGTLRPGAQADVAVFDEHLQPRVTLVGGVEVWRA